ncbi:hypothetical protein NDU88_010669 [Pleurodeles waltl]|uniref:Uncharacterized protein n=1 Tax=Pleurodeles waltl TaxID=8319 RepID=A0AAV7QYW1_PLEWA|nr:hypothetical protein NDU88_010669 [Pleurodeles waltl]
MWPKGRHKHQELLEPKEREEKRRMPTRPEPQKKFQRPLRAKMRSDEESSRMHLSTTFQEECGFLRYSPTEGA